ncbi:MAG: ribosome maturation factor RimP [Alphaproteobacteria bacterium]
MSVGEKEYLIEGLIAPLLTEAGYELVRVAIDSANEQRLQIMIERLDQRAISVDDCAHVSKIISALLELDDPITGPYDLEVSSPGIDRPLVKESDFERFAGFEVELKTSEPIGGKSCFVGSLLGIEEGLVGLLCNGVRQQIEISDIYAASLVLTDDLIKATQRSWKAAAALEGK